MLLIRIWLVAIIFFLSACISDQRPDFKPAKYQAELSEKNCDALALEKKFISQSADAFKEKKRDNYFLSDSAVTLLSHGAASPRTGGSTQEYYHSRLNETDKKLQIIEKIKKEKQCEIF